MGIKNNIYPIKQAANLKKEKIAEQKYTFRLKRAKKKKPLKFQNKNISIKSLAAPKAKVVPLLPCPALT